MKEILEQIATRIPRYFTDLLAVSIAPKRFIAERESEGQDALNDAFVFLGITLLIGYVVQIPIMPKQENVLLAFASYVAIFGLGLFITLIALLVSWRLVGGRATLAQLFVCTAYLVGPMIIIVLVFTLCGDSMFRLSDPQGYRSFKLHPSTAVADGDVDPGSFAVMVMFFLAGFLAASVWFFVAWGAYREMNGVSRTRSALAFVICNVLFIPLTAVSALLSLPMSPLD
jgi:Yip1 domain